MDFSVLEAKSQSTDSWTSAPDPVGERPAKGQEPGAQGLAADVRAGRVRWGVALPFGAAAMTGALGGGVGSNLANGHKRH